MHTCKHCTNCHTSEHAQHNIIIIIPYAYKFFAGRIYKYFANAPHLTISTILISQMVGCSILVLYACTFSRFYFRDHLLIRAICENKVLRIFVHIWYYIQHYFMLWHILLLYCTSNSPLVTSWISKQERAILLSLINNWLSLNANLNCEAIG